MKEHTLATIERGTTEWLARILVPGQEPHYFVPGGIYYGTVMTSQQFLREVVKASYPDVDFVNKETFKQALKENGE